MSWENIIKRKRWDDEKPDMSRYYGKSWAERQKEKEAKNKEEENRKQQKRESMSRNPKGRALLKLQEAEENSKKLDGEYRASEEYPNNLLKNIQKQAEEELLEGFYRFGIESMSLTYGTEDGYSLHKKIEEMFFKENYESLQNINEVSVASVSLGISKVEEHYFNSEFYSTLDSIEKLLKDDKKIVPKNLSIYQDILSDGERGVTITDDPMPDEQKSVLNRIIVNLIEQVEVKKVKFEQLLGNYEKDKNKLLAAKHEKAKKLDAAKGVEIELRAAFRKKYPSRR